MIAATAAILPLLSGEFDEQDGQIIGSCLGFAVASSIGSAGSGLWPGRLRFLGAVTALLAIAAYALFLAMLWGDNEGDLWRYFGAVTVASVAASHVSVVLGARKAGDSQAVTLVVAVSVLLAVIGAGLGIAGFAGLLNEVDDTSARWLGVLGISLILTSALPPVMRRTVSAAERVPAFVEIKVRHNGPYKVTGPIRLIDADGNEFDVPEGEPVALCRCGASTTKPFCDKTHSEIGFEAAERAVSESG